VHDLAGTAAAAFRRALMGIVRRLVVAVERTPGRVAMRWAPGGRGMLVSFSRGGRSRAVIARVGGHLFQFDLGDDLQRSVYYRAFERREIRRCLLLLRPGDTVLDIGANIGAYTVPMAGKVGERGAVHCFEPDPAIVRRLRVNCELNGYLKQTIINQVAMTDALGQRRFFRSVGSHSGWGSLEQFDDLVISPIEVEAITLDEYVKTHAVGHVRLIKMDVEGHEMAVLRGARRRLTAGLVDFLLIETNEPRLAIAGSSVRSLIEAVQECGFVMEESWPPLPETVPTTYCGNVLFRSTGVAS